MNRLSRARRQRVVVWLIGFVAMLATVVVFSGKWDRAELAEAKLLSLKPNGSPQLVSIEPMPQADGEMCQWEPASANASLFEMLQNDRPAANRTPEAGASVDLDRAPERTIRDPNPSFSAIAVEPKNNMLVVTDENLFRVLEYNRQDNTPQKATMTEPKRIIGGNMTKAEMLCGVYIDPNTLDTYVVNNDTQDWLAIFSHDQRGNVPPSRVLAVPHGTFGIAVDEDRQELYLTVQHQNEIIVYRKMASGNEKPLREIFGDDTGMEDPHGIALDLKDDLIFVSNHGSVSYRGSDSQSRRGFKRGSGQFHPPSITVYKRDSNGNVKPLRTIQGDKTRLNWPMQIGVDAERGELYVANDMDHSIVVFKTNDQGNVAPTRVITGPKTHIKNPTGIALDLKNNELWVASMGNHTATVFPITANGDVAPKREIRGGPADELSLMIGNPGAVGYDSKREQILVPN